MKGYGQFCPLAVACETLTERWTPLVLRELFAGSRRFNELRRGLPLMSPTLLSKRLRTLERAGIVEHADGTGYRLTESGRELWPALEAIGAWGTRWATGVLDPDNLDASLLMWDVRRKIAADRLPDRRVVVHFRLSGSSDGRNRFWLVLDDGADLCLTDPGFETDVYVDGPVRALVRYWLGQTEIEHLVRTGELVLTGPRALVAAFPTWFTRTPYGATGVSR